MFFVLAEKPFLAKIISCSLEIIFLFAGKKSVLQTQEKTPLPSSVFLHIYALFFVEI